MDQPSGDTGESLDKILNELGKGQIASCYLLYGDEEYLIQNALDKIIACILPASDRELNLFYMDGEHEDIDRLCESLMTLPLIPGRKIMVVRNTRIFHSKKTLSELVQKIRNHIKQDPAKAARDFITFLRITGWHLDDLRDDGWKKISDEAWHQTVDGDDGQGRETWLPVMVEFSVSQGLDAKHDRDGTDRLGDTLTAGLPEGNCLILTADTVDKRKRIFRILAEQGKVLYFSQIKSESKLKNVLMQTARDILAAKGKKLGPGAWLVLGKKTGFSLRVSMIALEKLMTFVGEKVMIEAEDVEAVIGITKEETVFHLTAAMMEKNLPKSLSTLKDLLDQGDHPLMILAILAREIRLLLHAKLLLSSGQLASYHPKMDYNRFQKTVYPDIKHLGGSSTPHPYVIYQALIHTPHFSQERLVEYLDTLVDIDLALKTTSKAPRLMMERFLLQVCSS